MCPQNGLHLRRDLRLLPAHGVRIQVPDADGAIAGATDHEALARGEFVPVQSIVVQDVPIAIKLETEHATAVSGKCGEALASLQTPHFDRPVPGARDDPRGVKLEAVNAVWQRGQRGQRKSM